MCAQTLQLDVRPRLKSIDQQAELKGLSQHEAPIRRPGDGASAWPNRDSQLAPITWSIVLRDSKGRCTIFGENVNGKNLNGQVVDDDRKDVPVCSCFADYFPVVPDVRTAPPNSNARKPAKPNNRSRRNGRGNA